MRTLLTITAAVEAGTGVALRIAPSALLLVLLGSPLDSLPGLVIGRVLGASLISLAVACWIARDGAQGRTAAGLVAAMLLYNIAVVSLLGYARIGLRLSGVGLWPATILHSALAVWGLIWSGRCRFCWRMGCLASIPARSSSSRGSSRSLNNSSLPSPSCLLPRQPRSAQILTAYLVQQQPIAAPEGSEINHGIHRNTRKRESESTSPFRVLSCVPWLPVCDYHSCRGNILIQIWRISVFAWNKRSWA